MKILVYTDIALVERYKAGNINALMSLLNHLAERASVDLLCTHYARPDRRMPPGVSVLWRPDVANLAVRKIRRRIGAERDMLRYKESFFKKFVLRRQLRRVDYDLVIVEYLENVALLDAIRAGTSAPVICDIHDLMSQRADAFGRATQAHQENLKVSRADEMAALARFDAVIALQAVEAAMIRSTLSDLPVMVTRRAPPILAKKGVRKTADGRTTIGFLGTSASFNVDAAARLLSEEYMIDDGVDYVIGGSVCQHVATARAHVAMLGTIDALETFYGRVDVLANLIGYGSGLKTKNLEALAHGVPVITTSVGAEGMEDLIGHGLYLADTPDQFHRAVQALKSDLADGGFKEKVSMNYETFFAPDRVFADFDNYLGSLAKA